MGKADHFRPGDFNRICDITGFKVKASDTREQWDGLIVRKESWDFRHPQDFVKGKRDKQSVSRARPEGVDQFLDPTDVTPDDL